MENVCVPEPPPGMFPVSHVPASLDAVCATPSLFLHVTVVPTLTVIDAGPKALLEITTVLGVVVGGGVDGLVEGPEGEP